MADRTENDESVIAEGHVVGVGIGCRRDRARLYGVGVRRSHENADRRRICRIIKQDGAVRPPD
ncbi:MULTISPECIES: hypothetical protein [Mesorhizobium]|uniref:hypothetical protein n=1 Tax=Mesorhizobium TaxID=68287 RepID=UPI00101145D7|nr:MULTISPECIES: hypothetical protein [Mesorhizobium]